MNGYLLRHGAQAAMPDSWLSTKSAQAVLTHRSLQPGLPAWPPKEKSQLNLGKKIQIPFAFHPSPQSTSNHHVSFGARWNVVCHVSYELSVHMVKDCVSTPLQLAAAVLQRPLHADCQSTCFWSFQVRCTLSPMDLPPHGSPAQPFWYHLSYTRSKCPQAINSFGLVEI